MFFKGLDGSNRLIMFKFPFPVQRLFVVPVGCGRSNTETIERFRIPMRSHLTDRNTAAEAVRPARAVWPQAIEPGSGRRWAARLRVERLPATIDRTVAPDESFQGRTTYGSSS